MAPSIWARDFPTRMDRWRFATRGNLPSRPQTQLSTDAWASCLARGNRRPRESLLRIRFRPGPKCARHLGWDGGPDRQHSGAGGVPVGRSLLIEPAYDFISPDGTCRRRPRANHKTRAALLAARARRPFPTITPDTRVLVLNTPWIRIGRVFDREELCGVAHVLQGSGNGRNLR